MRLTRKLVERFERSGLPARSVRLRLTAVYGALFLVCGVCLLAITYVLVRHATQQVPRRVPVIASVAGDKPVRIPTNLRGIVAALRYQNGVDLHQLLVESGIALAVMAAISAALGWIVAGRVLAPLRTITARTRRISERSLHERLALAGPRGELRELADTIDGLLARLEAAFEAQRRFVANASHELRTPLAMMRTRLDVASAKPERVSARADALDAGLRKDLDRVEALLDSFLMLARAGRGTLGERSTVSLDRLVSDAIAARHDEIAARQLELRTTLVPVSVVGSDTLLGRMVENVIENGVRHNHRHGLIDVACDWRDETARLIVENGGAALDEQSVAQLAQPFRRLGADRTGSHNGQGLGLSIVAAVADAHGGALELRARPQGGLRVEITLPAVVPEPAAAAPPLTTPAPV